jgi:translation initiation factor IF-2
VAADVDAEETLKPRAPVVTIMGHVDHGKTSLLDALRGTDVVRGEAGGITQHIGAYQIKTKSGDLITFLDTPGHEAFTDMRMRGANVTDIVVLVVAADDGIMPQTIEAIRHTRAAGVPMIVAITKSDKPEANPQRIRERLLEHEVVVEEMSGDVQDVEVSSKTGAGLPELIEKILLQAELLELRANPDRAGEATVIEAKLDKGKGPLATVLITRGTLKVGDILVVGTQSGRVRAMLDDKGRQVKAAPPALPVEVLGLGGVPMAGDTLTVVDSEARAREVAAFRQEQATAKRTTTAPASLENMFSALKAKEAVIEYPVVVKADVQGSVEAIVNALNRLSNDEIKLRVLASGVGAITESDVNLAAASNAPIIGFNVRPNAKAREIVDRFKVRMKYFDVIYHLTDDISKEMAGVWVRAHRNRRRPRRGQGCVPRGQAQQGRRSAGGRGLHPQGSAYPPDAQRRHRVQDGRGLAAPLQGRCGRSARGSGMRRGAGRHQRREVGRYPGNLRGRDARAHALSLVWVMRFRALPSGTGPLPARPPRGYHRRVSGRRRGRCRKIRLSRRIFKQNHTNEKGGPQRPPFAFRRCRAKSVARPACLSLRSCPRSRWRSRRW